MALKPCRECGKEVSTTAKTCPHCGTLHPANTAAAVGSGLMGCGCALTVLVPLFLLVALLLFA